MKNAILDYCNKKEITVDRLAKITGVSVPQLYLINKDPLYNVTIVTINKIYTGTLDEFKVGLRACDYLDHECLNSVAW